MCPDWSSDISVMNERRFQLTEQGPELQLTSVYQSPGVVGLPLLQTLPLPGELLHVVGPVLPRLHLHHAQVGVGEVEAGAGGGDQEAVPAVPAVPRILRDHGGGAGVGLGRHHGVDGVVDRGHGGHGGHGGHHAVVVVGVLQAGLEAGRL